MASTTIVTWVLGSVAYEALISGDRAVAPEETDTAEDDSSIAPRL